MTFYLTTPIYYVNDAPHIGTAYSTIIADTLTRYHKLFGEKTFLLTGTDEHGQKVQNAAKARGKEPQEHVDELVEQFKKVWVELGIDSSIFMRTTFDFHKKVVQECLQALYDKGDIYLHQYEGWYSVSEEIFYTDKDLVDGKSPTGKEVQQVTEGNYFFRMSKYQEQLIRYIEENPDFIKPEGKRSEVLGFLKQPLNDLCISRPRARLSWGIPLPFDPEYVTYVWFDALLNYLSAIGYRRGSDLETQYQAFWPHSVHLIGKDILIPHAVYWPTMLMGLGVPLPKTIFAHGWILNAANAKMSKSSGPTISPYEVKDWIGVDSFRYCLCREITLGNDAPFSKELAVTRVNAELANNLGNLLSRATNLVEKYFEGKIPPNTSELSETKALAAEAVGVAEKVEREIREFRPQIAIEHVITFLSSTNRYIDVIAPWKRAKVNLQETGECLYACLEALRIAAILLSPVMPNKMASLLSQLGWDAPLTIQSTTTWGLLAPQARCQKAEPLFPRLEQEKES